MSGRCFHSSDLIYEFKDSLHQKTYARLLISWFNTEYGPDSEEFYTRPEDMFETVLALIKQHNLIDNFKSRAYALVKNATDGWGHRDTLEQHYKDVYGKFIE
jgi:hypothetical protein